jgi:hypothetical protein
MKQNILTKKLENYWEYFSVIMMPRNRVDKMLATKLNHQDLTNIMSFIEGVQLKSGP